MTVWNVNHILTTYDMARSGYAEREIAKVIGITPMTFVNWKKKHPELRESLRRGYVGKKGTTRTFTLSDYVYQRLPEHLKVVWNKLHRYQKEKGGIAKAEALLVEQGKIARQCLFVHALMRYRFSLTKACRKVNITRQTYYYWLETEPEFADLICQIDEALKDFFEEHFIRLVESGDTAATIHAVKTKCRSRGYGEKIIHEGEIVHQHRLNVDALPFDLRKQLLQHARKQIEGNVEGDSNGHKDR